MLKQKYFLADIFILSAEKQPIKLSWRKIEWLQLVGMKYDKHKGDAHAITSSLSKSDYIRLKDSGKCESFKEFINDIV